MMKHRHFLYLIILVAFMSSCASSKIVKEPLMVAGMTEDEYLEKVIELAPSWECVTGKVALTLDMGKKGKGSINATMRMKRDEAIQLIVAPLLGIEVARLEISPDGILIIDRYNKKYINLDFTEISRLANTELDYNVLQCLFLNELFIPGKSRLEVTDAKSFQIELLEESALLELKSKGKLRYSFNTSLVEPQLQRSIITVPNTPYGISWKYSDFNELDGRLFPQHILLTVLGINDPFSLDMKFSKMNVKGNWEARTEVPSKYKEVTLMEILKAITDKKK